jgi:hypothetical protein
VSSSGDVGAKKLSRRRFIKLAGGSLAAGTAAVALGGVASNLLKSNVAKAAAAPIAQTSTTTVTATETVSNVATAAATAISSAQPSVLSPPLGDAGVLTENSFSIFWITDTQFLSETNPALFKMLNNWIVGNWNRYNGKLVIHTGDLVEDGPVQQEWENADDAMSVLLSNGIPYTWCAGNHDDLVENDATSGWSGSQFADSLDPQVASSLVNSLPYAHWVGDYHSGMNTAVSFSASGLDFLVVNLEWNAQPDALQWAAGILDTPAYANHHVIMAPHAYINAYGSIYDPRWGAQLSGFISGLTSLMDAHSSNVFLTLNGHFATECGYNTPQPINGRNQLMFDRQDCADSPGDQTGRGVDNPPSEDRDKVGGATVTVLTFETDLNQIRASTFDLYPGKWRRLPTEEYTVAMFPNLVQPKTKVVAQ